MRIMRVATISIPRTGDMAANLQRAVSSIEQAGAAKPDIICLPEAMCNTVRSAETVPGRLTDTFAALARKHGCYIIAPLIKKESDGRIYNVAEIIAADGSIVGEYKKMFPADNGLRMGITPGSETKVFETPKGRIGIATCFDIHFEEVIKGLVRDGVEVVFFISAFEGGRLLQRWALDYSIYVVSAHRAGIGAVVDKSGYLLQKGDPGFQPIIIRDLNMDREIFHLNFNWKKIEGIYAKYGNQIHIDVYRPEAIFALESRSPGLSITDLMQEYNLEPFQAYIQRCREMCAGARAGQTEFPYY